MKKKLLSFALALAIVLPCAFALVGCDHTHDYTAKTVTGYDAQGNYCKWEVCECDKKGDKTVIVEGVSSTSAKILAANEATSQTKTDPGVASSTFVADVSFNDAIDALNARVVGGSSVSWVKTNINDVWTNGLAITGDIKLTEDVVVAYNGNSTLGFSIVEDTTIDLNGHTITQQCGLSGALSGYSLFVVHDGATLNIIDSSKDHDGMINAVGQAIQINAGGVVNLYDGVIQAGAMMTVYDTTPADDPLAVWTISFSGGTFNQYGGKVQTVETRDVIGGGTYTHTKLNYTFSAYEDKGGTVNLYGGTVIGEATEEVGCTVTVNDLRD